ncbi:hypothetical protein F2P56_026692 [Juglans regia]|uniref:Reverse transcriptase Ty1/copia-type domain-containing protein n=2 Tax=Juglans regia TaxID=51240 RepID=A0A833WYP0_JUGRE|nr:uncharacterized mitochondrial protein AtMg00820-like [Juglans regia]KAF5451599.1 hypothetical protein F2P56_026692 [Juglans regia]
MALSPGLRGTLSLHLTTFAPSVVSEEPSSFTEATKFPEWRAAMAVEFDALLLKRTWDLISYDSNLNTLGYKWVLKTKCLADGTLERRKAHLVAKGFHQQAGVNFTEAYSHVVKPVTIRTILSISVTLSSPLHQLDIQNAFLHGDLEEAVYMQ